MTDVTDATTAKPKLQTGGLAWGPERVRLGISLTELSRRSGINKGVLSMIEHGRMVPSAQEYEAVMAVLRDGRAA
jgi:hypothetical protein